MDEIKNLTESVKELQKEVRAEFKNITEAQTRSITNIEHLQKSIESSISDNRSQHADFYKRIGNLETSRALFEKSDSDNKTFHNQISDKIDGLDRKTIGIDTRLSVMERIDDPDLVSEKTFHKIIWDVGKILIPAAITIFTALKLAGKI